MNRVTPVLSPRAIVNNNDLILNTKATTNVTSNTATTTSDTIISARRPSITTQQMVDESYAYSATTTAVESYNQSAASTAANGGAAGATDPRTPNTIMRLESVIFNPTKTPKTSKPILDSRSQSLNSIAMQMVSKSPAAGNGDLKSEMTSFAFNDPTPSESGSMYSLASTQHNFYFSFRCSLLCSMFFLIISPIFLLLAISITFSILTSVEVENQVVLQSLYRAELYVSDFLSVGRKLTGLQRQTIVDQYYSRFRKDGQFQSFENYKSVLTSMAGIHKHNKESFFLMDITLPNRDYIYVNTKQTTTSAARSVKVDLYDSLQEYYYMTNIESLSLSNITQYNMSLSLQFSPISYTEQEFWDPLVETYYKLSQQYDKALVPLSVQSQGADSVEERVYICYQENVYSTYNSSLFLGVTSVNVVVRDLASFIKGFHVSTRGFALVVELNYDQESSKLRKRLIAYKDYNQLAKKDETATNGYTIPEAEEIEDLFLRYIVTQIIPGSVQSVSDHSETLFRFQYGSESFLMAFKIVSSSKDLNMQWLTVICAPEIDFIGNLLMLIGLNVGVSILAFCFSMVFVFFFASSISKPLLYFSSESKAISTLKVHRGGIIKTRIREIVTLSEAFEKMKTTLRSFMRFVPRQLIVEMVEKGIEMKLGGQIHDNIAILFSDVEDFTTWSEKLEPQFLIRHVSEYFHVITEEIVNEEGTLDKYIGDAVMAFWGAPNFMYDTSMRACRAAIKCQERMEKLRRVWELQNKPLFKCRIGIHTGSCIIGNIGSLWRLNYTALGDSVNLASRLEGQNKFYGTEILISQDTHKHVAKSFNCRRIDTVGVKGKTVGITIYELISRREDGTASSDGALPSQSPPPGSEEGSVTHRTRINNIEKRIKFATLYESALDEYQLGQFYNALKTLAKCQQDDPNDLATQTLIDRCKEYLQNPPGNDWNGVYHSNEK